MITVPGADSFYIEQGEHTEDYVKRKFELMEQTLSEHHEEIAAVIMKPLVQRTRYMRMYDAKYISLLGQSCDKDNVHLIADEIALGFGRTGTLFVCEQASISPDFLCLPNSLAGGYLPLSVTLTNNKLCEAFYDYYETIRTFLHSHSFSGNRLACAAALTTLGMFHSQDDIQRNKSLIQRVDNNAV